MSNPIIFYLLDSSKCACIIKKSTYRLLIPICLTNQFSETSIKTKSMPYVIDLLIINVYLYFYNLISREAYAYQSD